MTGSQDIQQENERFPHTLHTYDCRGKSQSGHMQWQFSQGCPHPVPIFSIASASSISSMAKETSSWARTEFIWQCKSTVRPTILSTTSSSRDFARPWLVAVSFLPFAAFAGFVGDTVGSCWRTLWSRSSLCWPIGTSGLSATRVESCLVCCSKTPTSYKAGRKTHRIIHVLVYC